MFFKNKASQTEAKTSDANGDAPASTAGGAARGLTTLPSDVRIDGTFTSGGDLQLHGRVKGDVRVARLIVEETGAIEGQVFADYVEVRGRIAGTVTGKQVKLVATACVEGDITAEQLSIDIGAYFQGRCVRQDDNRPAETQPPRIVDMTVQSTARQG